MFRIIFSLICIVAYGSLSAAQSPQVPVSPQSGKTVPIWEIWGGVNPYAPSRSYRHRSEVPVLSRIEWEALNRPETELNAPALNERGRASGGNLESESSATSRNPVVPQGLGRGERVERRRESEDDSLERENRRLTEEIARLKAAASKQEKLNRSSSKRESKKLQRLRGVEEERDQLKKENRVLKSKLSVADSAAKERAIRKDLSSKMGRKKPNDGESLEKVEDWETEVRRLNAEMKAQQKRMADQVKDLFNKKIARLEAEGADPDDISHLRGEMMRQIIQVIDRIGSRYQKKMESVKRAK